MNVGEFMEILRKDDVRMAHAFASYWVNIQEFSSEPAPKDMSNEEWTAEFNNFKGVYNG